MKAVRQVSSLSFNAAEKRSASRSGGREDRLLFGMLFTHLAPSFLHYNPRGYQSRKSDSNKSSGPCRVNFGVKRTSNIQKKRTGQRDFCLALCCSSLKCGDKIQGTELATPHSSPAIPIPLSLSVKIQLLFYLFKMLNIPKSV